MIGMARFRGVPKLGRMTDVMRARRLSPVIDTPRVDAVMRRLGTERVGEPRNTAQGWRSDVVVVDSTDGKVVLKAYRPGWPLTSIEYEHAVLAELERQSFPAVRLRRTSTGASIIDVDGRPHVAFDYVRGINPSSMHIAPSLRHTLLVTSARVLARLHEALAEFSPVGRHHTDTIGGSGHQYLAWIDALNRMSDVPAELAGDHSELRRLAGSISRRLTEIESELEGSSLPETMVHGDFGLHNLIFSSPERAVVHDFELARRDRRMVDVAAVISRLAPPLRSVFEGAYRSASDVDRSEWDALALIWEEYRLRGAVRSWRNAIDSRSRIRMETAVRRVREADAVRSMQAPTGT